MCSSDLLLSVGVLAGCGNGGSSGAEGSTTFTMWIGKGEDSQYYSEYAENPILQYYLSQPYIGADGEEVVLSFEFQIPPIGSEKDNLSTLISTGDYTDIIDADFYSGSITDLYEEEIILDITEYVENYMPNYLAYLEANPELALTATNIIDGEKKYICIRGFNTSMEQFQGFEYRRDWIVKYGKHPVTGQAFEGAYTGVTETGEVDTESWADNVVFPSGTENPLYISDWEWMFEIFEEAMAAEGITDGYCVSIPFYGYSEAGYFNASFGGGSAHWFKNLDNEIEFGGDTENFRAYVQCMNNWYQQGWLDKAFAEHTGALPWRIDEVNVRQGKVGAWVGINTQLMNKMNIGDELTKDIIVFAAPYPMNDIYGPESAKNVTPFTLYQTSAESKTFVITQKAAKKDMVALFSFIDTLYEPENSVKNFYGLSKEEVAATQDAFYLKMGLEDGAFYDTGTTLNNGKQLYYYSPIISESSGNLGNAVGLQRIFGLQGDSPTIAVRFKRTPEAQAQQDILDSFYMNTGLLSSSFKSQLSAAEAKEFSTIYTNVNEFMSRVVPTFIKGEKDPYNDADWDGYVKALAKYNPQRNREIYQNLLDSLSN